MIARIVSRVVTVLLYYFVMTPVALAARACGKRFIDRRPDRSRPTYWRVKPAGGRGRDAYEHPY